MPGKSVAKTRRKTKVLFVCIGNSCRSQMAEALARHSASDVIEASSAGTAAFGEIAEQTGKVLQERGVPMDGQYSKQLREEDCRAADLIINMSGKPGATIFPAEPAKVEDWNVRDPYFADFQMNRQICDDIEGRLAGLADRLRRHAKGQKKQPRKA